MMKKLVKVGYRVAPMYNDVPFGTITEIVDELNVMVKWDDRSYGELKTKEQIKYLRKAS